MATALLAPKDLRVRKVSGVLLAITSEVTWMVYRSVNSVPCSVRGRIACPESSLASLGSEKGALPMGEASDSAPTHDLSQAGELLSQLQLPFER